VAAADLMHRAKSAYTELNAREQKLVLALGITVLLLVILLPGYLLSSSISEVEDENQGIAEILRELQRARPTLMRREAEREAAEERYRTAPPPLGSFIEARATEQSLSLREVTDQPEKVIPPFTRRSVRATLPGVDLLPVMHMLTAIANAPYPVAVDRIQIEHRRRGSEDSYNVTVGVLSYENAEAEPRAASQRAPSKRPSGRAGPPAPR